MAGLCQVFLGVEEINCCDRLSIDVHQTLSYNTMSTENCLKNRATAFKQ